MLENEEILGGDLYSTQPENQGLDCFEKRMYDGQELDDRL